MKRPNALARLPTSGSGVKRFSQVGAYERHHRILKMEVLQQIWFSTKVSIFSMAQLKAIV
jgi:hypothetical protein